MALQLRSVPPPAGARWVRDGFRLFGKSPLPFSLMFVVFLAAAALSSVVPLLGPVAMLAALPLLSLGFMVASESALKGGPIHPGQFISPLRGDARKTRSLLVLCALYGGATVAILVLSNWVDDGAFDRMQRLLAEGNKQSEIDALIAQSNFAWGLITRFGLAMLASIPFWHAPALVHWGGQGPAQALFSSTLAVWRSKGAFLTYALAWGGLMALFGALIAVLFSLLGMRQMVGIVVLPAGLIFSTVFYVSLLFTFTDSFGGTGATEGAGVTPPA
jgi:hypothetical protein